MPQLEESHLSRFGLTSFRPGQQEVIRAILQGRDCLCIMPTGGGKSLCYQLPAVLRDGTTLVVSPLIALMKDQVDALTARGIRASFINSSLTPSEQSERLGRLARQEYDLIYVAPERFRSRRFAESLRSASIQLVAVDEAHCISEWGHDFRHDYARLGEYRQRLGDPQTIALTATATEEVRADIATQLRLRDPLTLVAGFSRPNLHFRVVSCEDNRTKRQELIRLLRRTPGSGIIYASTRRACESIAAGIADVAGRRIVVYHGGLDSEQRRATQEAFMSGEAPIAVATNAFGMGIDKADVRFVVHYNFPGSIEAYYQEAGRAGRDGLPAECLLLYLPADRAIHRFFIESAYPERAIVRDVYEFLRNHADDPVEMTQQQLKESLALKISNEGIGTCERLLEKANALERLEPHRNMAIVRIRGDLPSLVDMLPKQASAQRQVLRYAERFVDDRRDEDVFFQPAAWAAELEMPPATLTRTLRELVKLESFDYVPPFRGRAVRVMRREIPFEKLPLDFAQLEQRKAADYRKLNRVISFVHSNQCRQGYILKYFGDPSAALCGACDYCRQATPNAPITDATTDVEWNPDGNVNVALAEAPNIHQAVRIVLSGVARTNDRVGKQLIVGMLAGSQAVKIRKNHLDRLSTFGKLAQLTHTEISSVVEACIEQEWLQQVEIERFRPVVRLTGIGNSVMRDDQPPDVTIRLLATAVHKLQGRTRVPIHGTSESSSAAGRSSASSLRADPAHVLGESSELPLVEECQWTIRVLLADFGIDDCAAIRRLPRETILRHLKSALERVGAGRLEPVFSGEQRVRLEKLLHKERESPVELTTSAQSTDPGSGDVLVFTSSGDPSS